MKKKIFNLISTPQLRQTGFWISLNPKGGSITFSVELGEKLKLDTTRLNFVQDEERPMDWYLEPTKDPQAFTIKTKKNNPKLGVNYALQNSSLVRAILDSCKLEKAAHKFMVAEEATEDLYAVITKSAKNPPPQQNGSQFSTKTVRT
jgi:hypothetical protein